MEGLKEQCAAFAMTVLWKLLLPLAGIFAVKTLVQRVKEFYDNLYVEGKPDEWVLILNNGQMIKAEVGLRTYKGYFDQVARFPSKVNKVEFSTEQVTQMQGVKVTGMLVWSINREDSGPFKAYQNLGADLSSDNPRTANDNLCQQASSIVRNKIANSTLMSIMRDRKSITSSIKRDMAKVCSGWGVWLETVEITEVTISSASLFKDLQADFREKMHQEAELIKMEVDAELNKFKEKESVKMTKIAAENRAAADHLRNLGQLEIKDMNEKGALVQAQITEEKSKMQNELRQFNIQMSNEVQQVSKDISNTYRIAELNDEIRRANMNAEVAQYEHEIEVLENNNTQEIIKANNNYENEKKKLDADLLKNNLDKTLMLAKSLKAGTTILKGQSVQELKLTSIDNTNTTAVMAQALASFNQVKDSIAM